MIFLEYSRGQYHQVIQRKSKMSKYIGYSRLFKLTKARKFEGCHVKFQTKIDTQKFSYVFINPKTSLKIKMLFV